MSGFSPGNRWLACLGFNPTAKLRMFCFPYGGAGASAYRQWSSGLLPSIELYAIQLPGRETRMAEPPLSSIDEVVLDLVDALAFVSNVPFVFFGHSLGAFIAFELARELEARGGPRPVQVIVSGQRAPHLPNALPVLYDLPDSEFLDALQRRYNAIPDVVRESPDLLQALVPMLRSDFTMHDCYEYVPSAPLTCPIAAFGSDHDPEATPSGLEAWRQHTSAAFSMKVFSGGHFYIQTEQHAVLSVLNELLAPLVDASVRATRSR
jgi:medium-chain acyl-[acyl-carrier-protein] hydrolase